MILRIVHAYIQKLKCLILSGLLKLYKSFLSAGKRAMKATFVRENGSSSCLMVECSVFDHHFPF